MKVRVTAERSPRGWWMLESENGAVDQVRRLEHADGAIREAVAHLAGIPDADIEIEVVPVLPEGFEQAKRQAADLRAQAELLQAQAAAANRKAASALAESGLTVRDIGRLMGISPQRASQLVSSHRTD
ncbi:hypothetical protein ATK17_1660 [Branchiibius hedensis]|uniref:Sigma-70, region 4 n=1 Tax=Branchiibius hedensis TaxID=672460 RepID=A0A2Y9C1H8_9MICO|nr:hypothetical protein [Branchiibius hedensis]PWJ25530.1 hypothetical protein ATK17_1660 [Branchiibius hedensis]SSA34343.1 hypothetical protein SAMN04489750_1660 [Branchiibius hedensis]